MHLTKHHLDADRHLQFQGATNFRDVGGYATQDGRRLAWRRLFRSDHLAALTEADLAQVAALGIRAVFDLRHHNERTRWPDRLPATPAPRVYPLGFYPKGMREMFAGFSKQTTALEVDRALEAHYRHFPLAHVDEFRQMLAALLEADGVPALVHCASGKDRTGFAVALVLMALGVPRATILEDFLLSNRSPRDLSAHVAADFPRDALQVLMEVRPRYLQAAFGVIDREWGSDQAYLAEVLGVGPRERERLGEVFLAPAAG